MLCNLNKFLLIAVLSAVCLGSTEPQEQQTVESVVKAVTEAENAGSTEEDKEAVAVAEAAVNVLKSQSGENLESGVASKAEGAAEEVFKELQEAKLNVKAAADVAAKVAIAEIDGGSAGLDKHVKQEAEKAAVAAGTGVAKYPNSQNEALGDAVATVNLEEKQAGKVDGLLAGNSRRGVAGVGPLFVLLPFLGLGFIAYRYYTEEIVLSPYLQFLRSMRKHGDVENGADAQEYALGHVGSAYATLN